MSLQCYNLVKIIYNSAPKAAQIAAYMSFFVIGSTNDPDLVAAFSIIFISGIILVIISFARISHFIHYTPYPVVAGFMCGIGNSYTNSNQCFCWT